MPDRKHFYTEDLSKSDLGRFKAFGVNSKVSPPFEVVNPQFIEIGDYVSINREMKLAAYQDLRHIKEYIKQYLPGIESAIDDDQYLHDNPGIEIGDRTSFGRFSMITATSKVRVGKAVIMADRVFISDCNHRFENPELPILYQGLTQGEMTEIGDHSWVGTGAVIIGCRVGKHCVVGANSVVLHNIPDYSVAVGVPAKVVKRYNQSNKNWEPVNPDATILSGQDPCLA